MDESESSPRRTTLLVVMLSITLALVLLSMVLVVDWYGNQMSRQSHCGKNQSQLLGACVAYSIEEEVPWPMPWKYVKKGDGWDLPGMLVTDAHQARLVTARTLEILATAYALPNALFKCPMCRFPGPKLKAMKDGSNGDRWGADVGNAVSYAFDWASPEDPSANRVIFADRDPKNHKDAVMACFGDAHVKKLKVIPGAGIGMVTENNDGLAIRQIIADPGIDPGEFGFPGNILSADDDNEPPDDDQPSRAYAPLTPAGGHPLRAWVK